MKIQKIRDRKTVGNTKKKQIDEYLNIVQKINTTKNISEDRCFHTNSSIKP